MKNNEQLLFPIIIIVLVLLMVSCEKILPKAPANDELLDGPVTGLNGAQSSQHMRGDAAFNDQIFTSQTGLGPIFVATSCGSCHAGDGKGHPSTTLTRFGQTDSTGNQYLKQGGPLLQNRALPGYRPEQLPTGAASARLTPPIVAGSGFLELVSDADIMLMVDPYDLNGDGITGVPNWNYIPNYITPDANAIVQGGKYICRFGKKASVYNLHQQTANAYNQDIGITSVFNPLDVYSLKEIEPEIPSNTVYYVVFYLQTLKVPAQRNQMDPTVQQGKIIFNQIGCSGCHKETLKTGFSNIESLSYKEFHPYTDLLLHDMGSGLNDGYTEGNAKPYEWRTAPLWGIGLAPNSQGGEYYLLHDGRARSIEEAIGYHGGEASGRRAKYNQLTDTEKEALLKFLKSL